MTEPDLAALEGRWYALSARLGAQDAAAKTVFADLVERHREPHRRYHNVDHIAHVIAEADRILASETGVDGDTVELTLWFHDAVYDPRRPDNEARSAALASTSLTEMGVGSALASRVAWLVDLTTTHEPGNDLEGKVVCDADLSILAAAEETYDSYATAVREEYAFVPDDAFRAGRTAVLRGLLARARLFHTAAMAASEPLARGNLERELARLQLT